MTREITNGAWTTVALEEVATIERSVIQPADIVEGTAYLGLEHIESGGKILGAKPVDEGELASSKFVFSEKHVLYGKLRPYLKKISCPNFSGICSTDILPILPGPKLDRRFLCYFLRQPSMVEYANSRAVGINLPRLAPSILARFQIPLPSLEEQRRIAEILDRAEALRAKRRAAIAQLDLLTQSIFLDLFGNPVANLNGWRKVQLLQVCDNITDGTHDTPARVQAGIPFITSKNIRPFEFDLSDLDFVSSETHQEIIKRCNPRRGDVLYTNIGVNVGNAVANRMSFEFSLKNVALIQPDFEKLDSSFLESLLNFGPFKESILKVSSIGGAQKFISLRVLRNVSIVLPPIALQREFGERATAVEKLKTAQRASLAEFDNLFASLQHCAFRGEL